jgi:hypothetical protein
MELPIDFPHKPPKGYHYEVKQFKSNIVSIWLRHPDHYNYTDDPVYTIWGFFDTKKQLYYSPINATKKGNKVDINATRCYTSMRLNLNPLERLLYE